LAQYDQLRVRNWSIFVFLGAYEHEQDSTQEVVLDVKVRGNFQRAAESDRLEKALDYALLRKDLEAWATTKRWVLLETLTSDLCGFFLARDGIDAVKVTVEKPGAQPPPQISCSMTRRK
jgi:dihydroneopterin aldolase